MKKILIFSLFCIIYTGIAGAGLRDDNMSVRQKKQNINQSVHTQQRSAIKSNDTKTSRNTVSNNSSRDTINRGATITSRDATKSTARIPVVSRSNVVTARATTESNVESNVMSETRTGSEYELCKNAYFTCMDQFCTLKSDDYRRCSCSDRVYDLKNTQTVMQDANEQLTVFTEGLDSVGMTTAQAEAMKTSSQGEDALTADTSSSKALLQAIMNSIRGEDTSVGGKFSDLNSINLAFDSSNAFGTMEPAQAVAAYNGKNLYTAVYGQCRSAVRADCSNSSLQRAVTAYLMAIEQDCNSVETSIKENQKKMTAAVREGNAMLDLARVENRQNHNSDDMTTCMDNVEKSVLSEEVCGANYHKCLDNGEFIDISTGKPIAGVVKFYELEKLLTFKDNGSGIADQKLSKIANNSKFVKNFENRVKKFAQPSLDKCTKDADAVWSDYLDKAMLDIYYSQKAKVAEIKNGCFDFVSACYVNGDKSITAAMTELTGNYGVTLQPDTITLNSAICKEYVESCDNMFDDNIIKQYVDSKQNTDTLAACRAVVKQCFDEFGGTNYENFYYPSSGLFTVGYAPNWFTLCNDVACESYISECAKQLSEIESCSSKEMMKKAFGGFDLIPVVKNPTTGNKVYNSTSEIKDYGLYEDGTFTDRGLRPSGVATEIYYQIIDTLSTKCNTLQGRFVELQFMRNDMYNYKRAASTDDNICLANFRMKKNTDGTTSTTVNTTGEYYYLADIYGVGEGEDMCPKGYNDAVDIKSWGACLCWENGARRSEWGTSVKCVTEMPSASTYDGLSCTKALGYGSNNSTMATASGSWCIQTNLSITNQVCPFKSASKDAYGVCLWGGGTSPEYTQNINKIPDGIL